MGYGILLVLVACLIGLLMWLWLTFIVILGGAELDSEVEHQAAMSPPPAAAKERRGSD